jgi:arylsulfatase A
VPVVNSHPLFVFVENHRVVGLTADDPFVYGKLAKTQVFPEKKKLSDIGGADAAHAIYDDEAVATRLTEKSIEWITANTDKPFFLYLATTNIHHPFTPAKRFQGTSQCGPYGDFVHELDWMVGEVMATLEKQGLAEKTLVIFTSDNGGMFNVGGQNAWAAGHQLNGDLLGFKFSAWEGGHRVPFIARWPGHIEAGSTSDQVISNIDLLATLSALTGTAVMDGQGRDSVNVLPALTGNPNEQIRDHIVLAASKPSHLAIRKGKWLYIGARGGGGFTAAKRGAHAFGGPAAVTFTGRKNSDIENGRIRLSAPPAQLYDLEKDLSQTTNLYAEYPEIVEELSELLRAHLPMKDKSPRPKKRVLRQPATPSN